MKLNSRSHHKVPSIVSRYNIILLPTENFFVATCNQERDNVCSQSQWSDSASKHVNSHLLQYREIGLTYACNLTHTCWKCYSIRPGGGLLFFICPLITSLYGFNSILTVFRQPHHCFLLFPEHTHSTCPRRGRCSRCRSRRTRWWAPASRGTRGRCLR